MHVLLIGCGRSGRRLAERLIQSGMDLVLIDSDEAKLDALADLGMASFVGHPIDQGILEAADIASASAVIAMDNNENLNIMACEMAKKLYHVPCCIARTYTPENEEFVRALGLHTICSTELTADAALLLLDHAQEEVARKIEKSSDAAKEKILDEIQRSEVHSESRYKR